MNKTLIVAIVAFFALGFALILASKIPPSTLFGIGVAAIIIGILLTAFVLYRAYKKD